MSYFNLLDALKENGCSFCFLLKKTIHNLLDALLYEHVNDPGVREKIRESLGFCSHHAWQLQKFGDGLGSSIIYSDLMSRVLNQIKEMTAREDIKISSRRIFKKKNSLEKTKAICPICKARQEAEERYISTFIESFSEPDFYSGFKDSFGLCLPHLMAVIENCKQVKIIKELLNIEVQRLEGLIKELEEFKRKHDYRFFHEGFGREGDSWIRAIEKMAGKEGVF